MVSAAATAMAFIGLSGVAHATGDFSCTASTPNGIVSFGANVGSDGSILLPPNGNGQIVIEDKESDLSNVVVSSHKGWTWTLTVIRRKSDKRFIMSFWKTTKKPIFVPGVDYDVCSPQHPDNCWSAQLRYLGSSGKINIAEAVCGAG